MLPVLRSAPNTFKNAKGLFVKDWYKPLVEAGVAIVLGIILSFVWGTFGVLFGYFVGSIVAIPIEYIVLYKDGFHSSKKEVWIQLLRVLCIVLVAGVICVLVYMVCSFLPQGIIGFVLKAIVSICIVTAIFVVATFRSEHFQYYKNMALGIFKRIFKRN